MRPGRKKSEVWEFFEKIVLDNSTSVKCKLCGKTYKYFGNTTNLKEHLKRAHPIQCYKRKDALETSLLQQDNEPEPGSSNQQDESSRPAKRQKQLTLFARNTDLAEVNKQEIDNALLEMIAVDFQPLSIVENAGFLKYSKVLQPLYVPPNRKSLGTKLLTDFYWKHRNSLTNILKNVRDVAVTTDMWSSDSMKSYITVTAHFIFKYRMFSSVLSTKEFREGHTGENIATVLSGIFEEWKISNKIVAVVSDNAANMKKAILQNLSKRHHPCVAHTLNLTVVEAIDSNETLTRLLQKCRQIVGHFKHSDTATQTLTRVQEQMGSPVLKVKQDVSTRWNSVLIMLERLQKLKLPLSAALAELPKAPGNFDAAEWQIILDCISILKPIQIMSTELSAENYPTLSLVVPMIRGLQTSLKNKNSTTKTGEELKCSLLDAISRRLGNLESDRIVAKAAFLDPRFKKLGFGIELNAKSAQQWVIEELMQLSALSIPQSNPECPSHTITKKSPILPENDLWAHFDEKVSKQNKGTTPISTANVIVRQYLELPYIERTNKFPLVFWEKNENSLGELQTLAFKYLCIPATSVPSERIFSKAGQLTNSRRSRLDPKKLDQIIFLNGNIKNDFLAIDK